MQTQTYLGEGQVPTSSQPVEADIRPAPAPTSATSILVADCGSVFTKVSLLGLVEGQFRLMARGEAPSTVNAPYEDITQGIIAAINEIEFITGRHFIADGRILSPEQSGGDGVDVFVATISAGGPMRIVVLGVVTSELEELAAQAVSGLYAQTYTIPAPSYLAKTAPASAPHYAQTVPPGSAPAPTSDAGRLSAAMGSGVWTPDRIELEWARQVERFLELQPHAALIVGSADGPAGPAPLQEACQLLINVAKQNVGAGLVPALVSPPTPTPGSVTSPAPPLATQSNPTRPIPVLYAGAPQYVDAVKRMLNGYAEVTRVDTLQTQAQLGPTSMATTALYERDVIQRIPGYDRIQSWSVTAPVASASSLSSLVRFLAQHYAMNVTAVDIGGATTTVMLAGERGEFIPMVNTGIGVGLSIGAVLQQAGVQRIARWLPFEIGEEELRQYVLNRMLHPQVLPTNLRDLQIGQAFAREAIILTVEAAVRAGLVPVQDLGQFDADLILATGGALSHAPKYGQAVLMLLDALQPRGVTSIVLDRTELISQLGAVATVAPIAAVQVNENDAVMHRLGTCVIPFGDLPHGQVALRVGVEYNNGRQVMVDVMTGSIEVVPLPINEQALLTLYPSPTVDVGLGPGERARAAEEIDGGLVGLIIDARGRPLAFPTNEAERHTKLLQWMQAVGA